MESILNWKGSLIKATRSKGGVLVVINPFNNLVLTGIPLWPPPEIIQKLYESRQIRAFKEIDAVTQTLGYYTDLQSIHSEDAITWSVFGTMAYADKDIRCAYATSLLELLKIPHAPVNEANFWIWRRVPHPQTRVSGGPEIDFGIQTKDSVILGEAKWLGKVGKGQGIGKDQTQLDLRIKFLKDYGRQIFPEVSNYVILALSLRGGMLVDGQQDFLFLRDLVWKSVCVLRSHHLSDELQKYLDWKEKYS